MKDRDAETFLLFSLQENNTTLKDFYFVGLGGSDVFQNWANPNMKDILRGSDRLPQLCYTFCYERL